MVATEMRTAYTSYKRNFPKDRIGGFSSEYIS